MPLTPRLPLFAATLTLLALMLAAVALNAALPPTAQAQTTPATFDYDSNDDGLIEITTLTQLNAIRWDLDGDGSVAAVDQANYAAAFPNAAAGMGCPDGSDADTNPDPCKGYELKTDLTFDSNGDGSVTAADSGGFYWNCGAGWTPLGDVRHDFYTGEFQGRGKVISHLFINNTSRLYLGLFGSIGAGGRVSGLGLEQVSISSSSPPIAGGLAGSNAGAITASYATGTVNSNVSGSGNALTGGLVGYNALAGTVRASFATAAVSNRHSQASAIAGGLVGQNAGNIQASYATGAVSVHGNTRLTRAGGLVGSNGGGITASYARGRAAASGSGSAAGGLVGSQLRNGRATNSYWDTTTSGLTSSAGGTGQTSSALQTPTGYTGIYASWNLNLDGAAGGDTPWYFGRVNQYPIPVYGSARDYDADNDRLIEVDSLTQLNALRWDLNGDGAVAVADQANYAAAFPWPATGMGCADGATAAACIGYELQTDLNFDTNGNGSIDANDQFWNNGAGWQPIGEASWFHDSARYISDLSGGFEGTFQGNGKTIANLYINHTTIPAYLGLFGRIVSTGIVDSVKLRDVNIRTQPLNYGAIGSLAAYNHGTIRNSSATGRIEANSDNIISYAGGLVGDNGGSITSSYTNTDITGNYSYVGGLAGKQSCWVGCAGIVASYSIGIASTTKQYTVAVGGLVGYNGGPITASYSRSPVTSTGATVNNGAAYVGGLVGHSPGSGSITASYALGPVVAAGNLAEVGGLAGRSSDPIIASYSLSPVKATGNGAKVGGLVGSHQYGAITASYAAGPVVATGTNSSVGGLVGHSDGGTATNSYWDTEVSGQSSSTLGTGKTRAELTDPTGYSGIYANWNLNLDGKTGNDDPWDFTHHYPKLKYGGLALLPQARIYPDYDGSSPVVGEAIVYRLNDGYHTRLGSDAIKWELSADGVSDWTAAPSSGSSLRSTGGTDYFVPKATEANRRLRNQVNTTESGWLESYITPPIKASWTGATAAASFASGHNPPRVGQSIAISGSDKVWWMFCAAATTGDCIVGDTNKGPKTSYTPGAGVQGKYLYAYRYYTDSNGVLTKASTGFIGPVQAAASPSP